MRSHRPQWPHTNRIGGWPFTGLALAEQLIAKNYLSQEVVASLLAEARTVGIGLPQLIRARGAMSDVALRDAMADIFSLPVIDDDTGPMNPAVIANYPMALVARRVAVPLRVSDRRLLVAVDDPTRGDLLLQIHEATGFTLDLRLATREELAALAEGRMPATISEGDADEESDERPRRMSARRKAAWIAFWSRVIAQAIGAAALVFLGLALAGGLPSGCNPAQ